MQPPAFPRHGCRRRAAVHEVAFPRPGGAVVFVARVACGGKVEPSASRHGVHRLADEVVLKRRLTEVTHIVHDDVATRRPQIEDVLCETRLAIKRRREKKLRVRREIVDDLQHRRPLPRARSCLAWEDRDTRQLPARERAGEIIHAVGKHPHFHPRAAREIRRPGCRAAMRRVALRGNRIRPRPRRAPHRLHLREGCDFFCALRENLGSHGARRWEGIHYLPTRAGDHREERRGDLCTDVHQHPGIREIRDVRRHRRLPQRDGLAAQFLRCIEKLGINLLLHRRASRLLLRERRNLRSPALLHALRLRKKRSEQESE